MKAHIKNALITSATVLVVIFIARKLPVAGPLVDKAIQG